MIAPLHSSLGDSERPCFWKGKKKRVTAKPGTFHCEHNGERRRNQQRLRRGLQGARRRTREEGGVLEAESKSTQKRGAGDGLHMMWMQQLGAPGHWDDTSCGGWSRLTTGLPKDISRA